MEKGVVVSAKCKCKSAAYHVLTALGKCYQGQAQRELLDHAPKAVQILLKFSVPSAFCKV